VRAALRRVLQEQSRTIRVPSRVQDTYSKIKRAESALLARSGKVRGTAHPPWHCPLPHETSLLCHCTRRHSLDYYACDSHDSTSQNCVRP